MLINNYNMKIYKKTLLFLLIGYLIFKLLSYFIVPALYIMISPEQAFSIDMVSSIVGTIDIFILYFFNIVIGISLIMLSRKTIGFPLLWFCLGAVFGINALILFYLVKLVADSNDKSPNDVLDR